MRKVHYYFSRCVVRTEVLTDLVHRDRAQGMQRMYANTDRRRSTYTRFWNIQSTMHLNSHFDMTIVSCMKMLQFAALSSCTILNITKCYALTSAGRGSWYYYYTILPYVRHRR